MPSGFQNVLTPPAQKCLAESFVLFSYYEVVIGHFCRTSIPALYANI